MNICSLIFFLLTFFATVSDNVRIGGGGNVLYNGPFSIAQQVIYEDSGIPICIHPHQPILGKLTFLVLLGLRGCCRQVRRETSYP